MTDQHASARSIQHDTRGDNLGVKGRQLHDKHTVAVLFQNAPYGLSSPNRVVRPSGFL
jgi:hypothetical protein